MIMEKIIITKEFRLVRALPRYNVLHTITKRKRIIIFEDLWFHTLHRCHRGPVAAQLRDDFNILGGSMGFEPISKFLYLISIGQPRWLTEFKLCPYFN